MWVPVAVWQPCELLYTCYLQICTPPPHLRKRSDAPAGWANITHNKLMSITLSNLNRFSKNLPLCSKLAVWCLGAARSARDNRLLACNFTKRSTILKLFTGRLSNKPFLIWLLTIPPHLECVATLPCNLSLIACFLKLVFHKVVSVSLIDLYCKFTAEFSTRRILKLD